MPKRTAEDQVIAEALSILSSRIRQTSRLDEPNAVRDYLRVLLAPLDRESFAVVFLDSQHRTIDSEVLFQGTLSTTAVYPREVARAALRHNAAGVIMAHNHPGGCAEPSMADRDLTSRMKAALAVVDVRVLDHFVVSFGCAVSFLERGLL